MIHYFQSTQTGAPQLNGLPSLISVLSACLVNGFNLRTLTSITRNGTIGTVSADAGHGFRDNDVVWIAGANQSAYNGAKRIRAVSTNSFQFDVTGDPQTPASGTLSAKLAPLDWELVFSAASKAVYRSKDLTSSKLLLRIDETPLAGDVNYGRGTTSCVAQMWEVLTDIDNGSGKSGCYWRKSSLQTADTRPWILVGDSKRFWFCVAWGGGYPNRYVPYFFGDFSSFKPGDTYRCLLSGIHELGYSYQDPAYTQWLDSVFSVGQAVGETGIRLPRDYSLLGGTTNAAYVCGVGSGGVGMGATGLVYPNPADNGIYVMPLLIQERVGPSLRGRLPGLLTPLHSIAAPAPTILPGFVLDGSPRDLLIVGATQGSGAGRLAFDLTGPWE